MVHFLFFVLICIKRGFGSWFEFGGFQCPSGHLKNPAVLTDNEGSLTSICKNLMVKVKEDQTQPKSGKFFIRVSVSHSSLPGNKQEIELLKKSLPTDEEDLNDELQSLKLGRGPAATKWKEVCGNFYLHVSIWEASSSKEKLVEFDSLPIKK